MLNTTLWLQIGLHGAVAALAFMIGLGVGLEQELLRDLRLWLVAGAGVVVVILLVVRALRSGPGPDRDAAGQNAKEMVAVFDGHLVRHDALTGLLNRTVFVEQLQKLLDGTRRDDGLAAVLCVDLKDFRKVNGTLGSPAGDLLLRHTGARLLSALRETDIVARTGADEFAIIQGGLATPDAAGGLCERLLRVMEEPFDLCGQTCRAAVSIGIALHPADGTDAEALIERARMAVADARTRPGSAFRFYDQRVEGGYRQRRRLGRDLGHALERGDLLLHYQPQIEIGSRRMIGVEALLRWQHAEQGLIRPDVLIPLAESSGLMLPIGAWVLEEACAQAARWQAAGASDLRIAVNLSPIQFRHPDLAGLVAGILSRTGLAAHSLELEITERALMENTAANLGCLERLRAEGVRISIDDFGAGHACIAHLQRFEFDQIKVDRLFVAALGHNRGAAAIVRATLALGRSLGIGTVAEGVETAEQLALLEQEGCALAQGFYFSHPVAAPEIDAMIRVGATTPVTRASMLSSKRA